MTVESSQTISGLDKALPRFNDKKSEGDDHLRLIKQVLKAQFPGSIGQGFSKTITASEDEINRLVGVTSPIQDQLNALSSRVDTTQDNLYAPPNTTLIFGEVQVPVGWSIDHYGNDHMLRIIDPDVDVSPGYKGGIDSPIQYFSGHIHNLQISSHKAVDGGTVSLLGHTQTDPAGTDWYPRYLEAVIARKD